MVRFIFCYCSENFGFGVSLGVVKRFGAGLCEFLCYWKVVMWYVLYIYIYIYIDRLCGLVVRVSGYRYRGPGFDPRRYQIF